MLIDPYRYGGADPFFSDVVLLLTGNTGEIIEWVGGATVTEVGAVALSTDEVFFGTHSIRNPNSNFGGENDGIIARDSINTDRFTFDGEFTIEGWFFPIDLGGLGVENLVILLSNSANLGPDRYALELAGGGGVIRFRRNVTVLCGSAAGAIVTGARQHVAVARDSLDTIRIFVDGDVVASGVFVGSLGGVDENGDAKLNITIGVSGQVGDFNTYFDQIRVTRACRYTGAFTPPDTPFPTS
jgi:hypothetical protein